MKGDALTLTDEEFELRLQFAKHRLGMKWRSMVSRGGVDHTRMVDSVIGELWERTLSSAGAFDIRGPVPSLDAVLNAIRRCSGPASVEMDADGGSATVHLRYHNYLVISEVSGYGIRVAGAGYRLAFRVIGLPVDDVAQMLAAFDKRVPGIRTGVEEAVFEYERQEMERQIRETTARARGCQMQAPDRYVKTLQD